MNESFVLIVDATAGVFLGMMFFGGLWWTVRKGVESMRPALLFLSSFLFRTATVLVGFYFIMLDGHWERLVAGLLGFLLGRVGIMRFVEASHAPKS
jgi:F1F0 ATPase subunit 2